MALNPEYDLDDPSYAAWLDLVRDLREILASPRYIEGLGETLAQAGRAWNGDLLGASRRQVSEYLAGIGATRSAGTANKRFRDLRRFYNWAHEEGLVTENPMARVKQPPPDHKAPHVLTRAELDALVRACEGKHWLDLRDRAIVLFWCDLGSPRSSEVANLLTADVDLRRDEVLIHGKGRRERRVPLGPATARAFSRYARARDRRPGAAELPQFFLGQKGPLTRSGLGRMARTRGARAGITVHPHMFRHAATIAGQNAKVPDRAIATLNGWSSTRMCDVYGRAGAAAQAAELARAANLTSGLGSGRKS